MSDIRYSDCRHKITVYWNRNDRTWKVECMKCRQVFKSIASYKKDSFAFALAAYKKMERKN